MLEYLVNSIRPEIVIKQEEVMPSPMSSYVETDNPKTHVMFCSEKGYWVRFGFPANMIGQVDQEIMTRVLRGDPYAFVAHDLTLSDPKHKPTRLKNVPVVFMHGYNDGQVWRFSNRWPVVDYVTELNKYLLAHDLPAVQLVAACNKVIVKPPTTFSEKIKIKMDTLADAIDPLRKPINDITVQDFNNEDGVAQVAGELLDIWMGPSSAITLDTGKIDMTLGSKSDIFGFDDLILKQKIERV